MCLVYLHFTVFVPFKNNLEIFVKYEKVCNNCFLCCPSVDMLMSSDKDKDAEVIPEDSSLLTLRYVATIYCLYPHLREGKKTKQTQQRG